MNPRYPQQQERQSPQDHKLAMLAGLIGLTNQLQGPQLQQQDSAEHAHQNRVMAALQMLGINNQQQEQQNLQGFRQQELQQRGDIAGQERMAQQQHYGQEADATKSALAAHLFSTASAMPGTDLKTALSVGGIASPDMLGRADEMGQQQRQQAIQITVPQLRAVTDPKAREAFGRAQLGKFPGAYEEALGLAYPQTGAAPQPATAPAPPGLGMFTTTPSQAPRQGGIFSAPTEAERRSEGLITDPNMSGSQADSVINNNLAQQAAQNQATRDHIWNILFGTPTR